MLTIQVPKDFRIIAHRGASAYAPENTLEAFKMAQEMGTNEFETDTRLSKDSEVILCHDETLRRYGHSDTPVNSLTLEELQKLDMGSWFSAKSFPNSKMLTLKELLETFKDSVTFHIELKDSSLTLPGRVFETIEEYKLRKNCIITSFYYDSLSEMRKLDSHIRLAWILREPPVDVFERAASLQLFQLCPNAALVTPEFTEQAHKIGAEVRAWRLRGSPEEVKILMQRVLNSNCNGVTIDWPDWLKHTS